MRKKYYPQKLIPRIMQRGSESRIGKANLSLGKWPDSDSKFWTRQS